MFQRKVFCIGQEAGGTFGLRPNANPSSTFSKIIRRQPVQILLTDDDQALRTGMLVEVCIDVWNR